MTADTLKTRNQAYLARLFLLMANNDRYGKVKAILDNNYFLGKQEYPQDLLAAKRLLAEFKGKEIKFKRRLAPGTDKKQGVAFVQTRKNKECICCNCGSRCPGE